MYKGEDARGFVCRLVVAAPRPVGCCMRTLFPRAYFFVPHTLIHAIFFGTTLPCPPSPTDPVPAGPRTAGRPRTRHLARKFGILDAQNTRGSHTPPPSPFFACDRMIPRSSGLGGVEEKCYDPRSCPPTGRHLLAARGGGAPGLERGRVPRHGRHRLLYLARICIHGCSKAQHGRMPRRTAGAPQVGGDIAVELVPGPD